MTGISEDIAEIDKYSGDIILYSESATPGTVTITITKTDGSKWSNTKPITVNFKWVAPQIGDIAYSDGSFSQSYTDSKTAVGIVYAIDSVTQDTNGDSIEGIAHIIGVDMAADNQYLGYHYDAEDSVYTGTNDMGKALKALYEQVETSSGFGLSGYSDVDTSSSIYEDNITVASTSILNIDPSTYQGKNDTNIIVKHVSKMLDKLSSKFGTKINSYLTTDSEGNTIIKDSGSLDIISGILTANYAYSEDFDYTSSLLYPYYYKMYLYQPKATDLDPQYARYNWYAPSAAELSRVIYYRGYSAKGNNFTQYHEVGDDISTSNIASEGEKVAIYCNKNTNLIKNCSVFLQQTGGINAATTSSPTDGNFRSYEVVRYYSSGYKYEGKWVYGVPKSSIVYNEAPDYSTYAWKLAKHSGVPFVQYKYTKPV